MRRRIGSVLVALLSMLVLAPDMASAGKAPTINGQMNQRDAEVLAKLLAALARKSPLPKAGGNKVPVAAKEKPFRRRLVIPACPNNGPEVGRDANCQSAVDRCEARGVHGAYMVWIFMGPAGKLWVPKDDWELTGARCVRAAEIRDAQAQLPALTLDQFRRLPLPAGGLHLQPDSRRFLVNMPTNLYVTGDEVHLRTSVLGIGVDVIATPVRYVWMFGDGERLSTSSAGHPYPDMTTTHTYRHTGTYAVGLTTSYLGRYRLANDPSGSWIPLDGMAEVPSPPVQVEVSEARAVLVD